MERSDVRLRSLRGLAQVGPWTLDSSKPIQSKYGQRFIFLAPQGLGSKTRESRYDPRSARKLGVTFVRGMMGDGRVLVGSVQHEHRRAFRSLGLNFWNVARSRASVLRHVQVISQSNEEPRMRR